jgi:hypothetical protein
MRAGCHGYNEGKILETIWLLSSIILVLMFLAAAIDEVVRKKSPVDLYQIPEQTFEVDMWTVEQVFDLKKFFSFVFSQATEEDCLIIKTFTGCTSPHLWMKFTEHEYRDNLGLFLTTENKRDFLAMLDEVLVFSNVVYQIQITDGKNWLLLSDDWPSACWLSDRIPVSEMKKAASGGSLRYNTSFAGSVPKQALAPDSRPDHTWWHQCKKSL